MGFSLPRFLRHTSAESLGEYVQAQGLDSYFEGVIRDGPPKDFVEPLMTKIDTLPDAARDALICDFERVDQLGDETGQRALWSCMSPALRDKFAALGSDLDRGLLVLVADAAAFDRAVTTAYVDRHWHGRSWGGFSLAGAVELRRDTECLQALESDVAACFRSHDGSGRRVMIDYFQRLDLNGRGTTPNRLDQFTIYVEGVPNRTVEFDNDGQVTSHVVRRVIEAAICCDSTRGQISVISKGGRPVRDRIARAFAAHMVYGDADPQPLHERQLSLDRLKRPMKFVSDPEDGIQSVQVASLRLAELSARQSRVTIEVGRSQSIHDACAQWWGVSDLLRSSNWRVTKARLRFAFHPEAPGRRDKTITVELTAPHSSNIKDQTQQYQRVCEKCLERWELIDRG